MPPASEEEAKKMHGPERFFYSRSSYTGVHKNGGPDVIPRDLTYERSGVVLDRDWLRPGHQVGTSWHRPIGQVLNQANASSSKSAIQAKSTRARPKSATTTR